MRAAIVTSFTADYKLGHLTWPHNKRYADKHGYEFICRIQPPSDWMSDKAKRHPTWDKVELLIALLHDVLRGDELHCAASTTHLLWIDADAVVVNQEVDIESLWAGLPSGIELLVGEDVSPTCLVNAGVLCVRVSDWSLKLWTDIWASPLSRKYYRSPHREQSCLLRQLAVRGEGLDRASKPFHSYLGGARLKLFPHVAVMPRFMINTNRGDLRQSSAATILDASQAHLQETWRCDFIFHAAGHPILMSDGYDEGHPPRQSAKVDALMAMLAHHGLVPKMSPGQGAELAAAHHSAPGECSAHPLAVLDHQVKRLRYPGRIWN